MPDPVTRPRHWTQIDPRRIREELDYAERFGVVAAAEKFGHDFTQVYVWRRWRAECPGWPTEADIADWDAWEAAHAENRVRVMATKKRYDLLRRPLSTPAIGTARRLQALAALGWSQNALARQLGCGKKRISQLTTMNSDRVYLTTAERVAALYDRLCMTRPPGWTADRARREAAGKGYAPPLAWNDDEIDDPKARPRFGPKRGSSYDEAVVVRFVAHAERPRKLRADEAAEAYRRLRRMGYSSYEIEHRWGLNAERYAKEAS